MEKYCDGSGGKSTTEGSILISVGSCGFQENKVVNCRNKTLSQPGNESAHCD